MNASTSVVDAFCPLRNGLDCRQELSKDKEAGVLMSSLDGKGVNDCDEEMDLDVIRSVTRDLTGENSAPRYIIANLVAFHSLLQKNL